MYIMKIQGRNLKPGEDDSVQMYSMHISGTMGLGSARGALKEQPSRASDDMLLTLEIDLDEPHDECQV